MTRSSARGAAINFTSAIGVTGITRSQLALWSVPQRPHGHPDRIALGGSSWSQLLCQCCGCSPQG
eukprot:4084923-Amphidinium_carterae.1